MAVRIIRKSWWIDVRHNRKRYRMRSPDNSRAGALAYEARLRRELASGADPHADMQAACAVPSFESFAWQWFKDYVESNNKLSEQRTKRYILSASLVPFFGRTLVDSIGAHQIERYKAEMIRCGIARKTINNRLTVLHTCLRHAHDWLGLKGAPPAIKWLKSPPPRTDYLTEAESTLLLRHADDPIRDMILAGLRTGMRQGELKGLQWDAIDWTNRSLAVRHSYSDFSGRLETPKNNRERHLPLAGDLFAALSVRRRPTGFVFLDRKARPFDHYRLSAELAAVCKRARLRRITWHVLRHSFATQLAMKGVPLPVVQTLMGHSTIATTMRYSHVAPSALRAAIGLLAPEAVTDFGQPVGNAWSELHIRTTTSAGGHPKQQPIALPKSS